MNDSTNYLWWPQMTPSALQTVLTKIDYYQLGFPNQILVTETFSLPEGGAYSLIPMKGIFRTFFNVFHKTFEFRKFLPVNSLCSALTKGRR